MGPDVPAEDLDGQTFPLFNLKSPTSLMNGWLHMLQSASLLFFVMCCQLMTSVGRGHRGEGGWELDGSMCVGYFASLK